MESEITPEKPIEKEELKEASKESVPAPRSRIESQSKELADNMSPIKTPKEDA